MSSSRGRVLRAFGVALTAIVLAIGFAFPAAAAEAMRVTFVRHGQSYGNASGLIDTKTPGPDITELGQQQAEAVVGTLGYHNYDAIYASQMVRTQQTAAPMADYLRLPVTVLPGIQEIEAGVFEGTPESQAAAGYGRVLAGWALGGAQGMGVTMPGTTLNGYGFDARMDQAMQTIYDNGDRNSVVFSHGGAIMFWTMMNAQNLTQAQKLTLLQTAPLKNTDYVVVEGNNEDGWTLVNWNGQQFSPDRTLAAEFAVQLRTLTRQFAASATKIVQAIASFDFPAIVKAVGEGISDSVYSVVKFGRAMVTKVIADITAGQSPTPAPASVAPATLARATTAATEVSDIDSDAADNRDASTGAAATGDAGKAVVKLRAVEAKDEPAEPTVKVEDEVAADVTDEPVVDSKDEPVVAKDTTDETTAEVKDETAANAETEVKADSTTEVDNTSSPAKSDDTAGSPAATDSSAEHRDAA